MGDLVRQTVCIICAFIVFGEAGRAWGADMPVKAPPVPYAYNWNGFYVGGHAGQAWGRSNWTTDGRSGALSLYKPFDSFNETGSIFAGVQAGYDSMLANRVVFGVAADASF